ncbi:MAG: hypothetical protein ABI361_01335 [Nitrososphaera sp.]|jgi:hypothetical protein
MHVSPPSPFDTKSKAVVEFFDQVSSHFLKESSAQPKPEHAPSFSNFKDTGITKVGIINVEPRIATVISAIM